MKTGKPFNRVNGVASEAAYSGYNNPKQALRTNWFKSWEMKSRVISGQNFKVCKFIIGVAPLILHNSKIPGKNSCTPNFFIPMPQVGSLSRWRHDSNSVPGPPQWKQCIKQLLPEVVQGWPRRVAIIISDLMQYLLTHKWASYLIFYYTGLE